MLRLKDVARVELGAQSYDQSSSVNGMPSIAIGVFLQSGANALDVGDAQECMYDSAAFQRSSPG